MGRRRKGDPFQGERQARQRVTRSGVALILQAHLLLRQRRALPAGNCDRCRVQQDVFAAFGTPRGDAVGSSQREACAGWRSRTAVPWSGFFGTASPSSALALISHPWTADQDYILESLKSVFASSKVVQEGPLLAYLCSCAMRSRRFHRTGIAVPPLITRFDSTGSNGHVNSCNCL